MAESNFFESGGVSCRILYRMNGLESAMRFLLTLLSETLPVDRINIMCAASDLSVFVPIVDTAQTDIGVIRRHPCKRTPFIEPDRLSSPVLIEDLEAYKVALREEASGYVLPLASHASLLRLPLFRRGIYIFFMNFWSNTAGAFREDHIESLYHLIRPLLEDLQDKFSYIESVSAPISESGTGYEGLKRCHGLAPVLQAVDKVAPMDSTVLICGETGVGKEGVAEAVHELSLRCKGPFVRVNCGAIVESLIDSELFGHEKGAFTGAHSTRIGYFELAAGGTLFLDEVGELPLSVQSRLLRVIDGKVIMRVGNPRPIPVDVRLVAATNRDLEQMVREGAFRQDLYYRLAVYPIEVPPLRQRKMDIRTLTEYFIHTKCRTMHILLPPRLSQAEEDTLYQYDWPGNVRELEHVVERALINARTGNAVGELRLDVPQPRRRRREADLFRDWPTLEEMTEHYIDAALKKTEGRLTGPDGAAALLGIHYTTLRAHLNRREKNGRIKKAKA